MEIKRMKNGKTKWLLKVVFIIGLSILWYGRIIYINKKYDKDIIYFNLKTNIDYGGLVFTPEEVKLLSVGEFESYFNIDIDSDYYGLSKDDKIISLRFRVKNTTDKEVEWDQVFGFSYEGFETLTWASACNPFLEKRVNIVYDDMFKPDCEVDLWCVTSVSKSIFRESVWRELSEEDFIFTLSIKPTTVKIRLK